MSKTTTIHSINVKLPDGSIECRRFRLEFSSHIALSELAQKAFNNKSRVAKECAGAIVVTALPPLTSGNDQMSGHTPGPWRVEVAAIIRDIPRAGPDDMVAALIGASEADQRLIAAAPDLLAALQNATRFLEANYTDADMPDILPGCRSAIAKAIGVI